MLQLELFNTYATGFKTSDRKNTLYRLPPSADRGKLRSKTFAGIANVMAKQWTEYCL